MPQVLITISDDELAALVWTVALRREPTIPNVATWLYLNVRGEIRAVQLAYQDAKDAALLAAVKTAAPTEPVATVLAEADAALGLPGAK